MSYAIPADMIARKSVQTLGDLCSDSGTRITPTLLLTDANLQAALDSASGEIDAALMVGGKYQPSDLTAIMAAAAGTSAYNSRAHLVRMCCEIAWAFLLSRKPDYDVDDFKVALELQDVYLERLRKGQNVFNVAANIAAGTPKYDAPTVASVESKGFIRDRTLNTFPARFSQSG